MSFVLGILPLVPVRARPASVTPPTTHTAAGALPPHARCDANGGFAVAPFSLVRFAASAALGAGVLAAVQSALPQSASGADALQRGRHRSPPADAVVDGCGCAAGGSARHGGPPLDLRRISDGLAPPTASFSDGLALRRPRSYLAQPSPPTPATGRERGRRRRRGAAGPAGLSVVNDHCDCMSPVAAAAGAAGGGCTLVHIDAHPDLAREARNIQMLRGCELRSQPAAALPRAAPRGGQGAGTGGWWDAAQPFVEIATWILPLVATGAVSRVVWVAPAWARQMDSGRCELAVVRRRLSVGESWAELKQAVGRRCWILDFDEDFVSCGNPPLDALDAFFGTNTTRMFEMGVKVFIDNPVANGTDDPVLNAHVFDYMEREPLPLSAWARHRRDEEEQGPRGNGTTGARSLKDAIQLADTGLGLPRKTIPASLAHLTLRRVQGWLRALPLANVAHAVIARSEGYVPMSQA
eukprot:gene17502-16189_t